MPTEDVARADDQARSDRVPPARRRAKGRQRARHAAMSEADTAERALSSHDCSGDYPYQP